MRQLILVLCASILLLNFRCTEALPQFAGDPLNNAMNIPNNVLGFFQNMFNNVVQGIPNIMAMFSGPSANAPDNSALAASASGAMAPPSPPRPAPPIPPRPAPSDRDIEQIDDRDYSPKKDVEVFRNDADAFNE